MKPLTTEEWMELCYKHEQMNADYVGFRGVVIIDYDDGTHLLFRHAFAVEDRPNDRLIVHTEHSDWHMFSLARIEAWDFYTPAEAP